MGSINRKDSAKINSINPLNCTYPEFLEQFQAKTGRGKYFARPLYKQVLTQGILDLNAIQEFRDSPKTLENALPYFKIQSLKLLKRIKSNNSEKWIFITNDGYKIETVLISMTRYKSLCISTQVGCRMGCAFCKTASMGLIRNLDTWEIISQFFEVKLVYGENVRNIVFMGMGEPLDNYDAVKKSILIFTDDYGFNLKRTHITISTCGLVEGIRKLGKEVGRKCCLAVSLNAGNDRLRSRLMPVNRKYPLNELKQALLEYPLYCNTVILFEYVLIAGVNDSIRDAEEVRNFLQGLKCRLNLIPYNPGSDSEFKPPCDEAFENFYQYLLKAGVHVIRRISKGGDISAACGQLGGSLRKGIGDGK